MPAQCGNCRQSSCAFGETPRGGAYEYAGLSGRWATAAAVEAPTRLQSVAARYLGPRLIGIARFDSPNNRPERPPALARSGTSDPIGPMPDTIEKNTVTDAAPAAQPEGAQ